MSHPDLFNSVTNRSNEILKTPQDVGQSKIFIDAALEENDLASINPQDVLESVDLSSSDDDESISISLNNVERKTSVEFSQAQASVDEVEIRSLRLGNLILCIEMVVYTSKRKTAKSC